MPADEKCMLRYLLLNMKIKMKNVMLVVHAAEKDIYAELFIIQYGEEGKKEE